MAFEPNQSFSVSDIFADRARAAGYQVDAPSGSAAKDSRTAFLDLARLEGRELCAKVGIPYVDTTGFHDVTMGNAPFGDLYYCDMLADLFDFRDGSAVLDFGCSTGRVIRNLKAAFPNIRAFGCDPRAASIEFIAPQVPEIDWFVSDEAPPLPKVPKSFDLVFAISVWSHFSEARALDWFSEMARVISPGGRLVFSTHGIRSVFHLNSVKKTMPDAKAKERLDALEAGRFHFMSYGGTELGRHWGMAFVPRDWAARKLSADWSVAGFHPGLAMANQDVYVLERRA